MFLFLVEVRFRFPSYTNCVHSFTGPLYPCHEIMALCLVGFSHWHHTQLVAMYC